MQHIGVTGHRGLSQDTKALVAAALHKELEPYAGNELIRVSCLAGGPDQLFARAVLGLGGKPEVVVPAEQYRDGLDPDEQRAYDELFAKASQLDDRITQLAAMRDSLRHAVACQHDPLTSCPRFLDALQTAAPH